MSEARLVLHIRVKPGGVNATTQRLVQFDDARGVQVFVREYHGVP